ncbi:MAG: hypothetical protein EOP33_06410 [Rickettsiaceae bacterium]|nr:MAG: hypothetical protein EOP33_06410 [Rickettsiaceae bacterium]
MDISIMDIIIIVFAIFLFSNFDLNLLSCYFVYKLFDSIFSVYLRLAFCKYYYNYVFDKNSKQGYLSVLSANSKIYMLVPNKEIYYVILSVSLININFNLWLIYWILYELVDLFGPTMTSEYDQALFSKYQGYDIDVLPLGFIKLNIYKKTLLDKKTNLKKKLQEELPNFCENDIYFEYGNRDFKFIDLKLEYLASKDCFYY